MIDNNRKKSILLPLIILIISVAIGNIVGKLLGILISGGILHKIISEGFPLHLDTLKLSLGTWYLEFGFNIDLNLLGFLFMLFFLIIYKKA